jgi:hypothetical protein
MPRRVTIERYDRATDFLAAAEPWLLDAEPHNNMILSVAKLLTSNDHPFHDPIYLAVVRDAGRIVGCAIRPPPDQLELTELPEGTVESLVEGVAAAYPDLAAAAGPERTALEFARAWTAARGGRWHVRHRWRLHVLHDVVAPRPASGQWRPASDADWPALRDWAPRYGREVNSRVDVTALFSRMLRRGSLYVWDDGGPACVVAVSGCTPNGARISAVYTPDELRNRGYASNAVAATSRSLLESGRRFCVLFADLDHVTPLRIYQAIGYRPLRDHVLIDFDAYD